VELLNVAQIKSNLLFEKVITSY